MLRFGGGKRLAEAPKTSRALRVYRSGRNLLGILREEGLKVLLKRIKNELLSSKSSHEVRRPYTDFSGFHVFSMVSPEVHAPFLEADKRSFAFMENVANHLAGKTGRIETLPLFSVLMVVCNRKNKVLEAIDSVLRQTYDHLEIIIVEEDSIDDGTARMLAAYSDARVRLVRNETNPGRAASLNQGIESAKGEYIGYIDADTTWDERYLAVMAGAFQTLPEAEALYGGQLLYLEDSEKPYAARFGAFNRALLQNKNYIGHSAFCHRSGIFGYVDNYDEKLGHCADWDFILRVSEKSRMYSVPVLLSNYNEKAFDNIEKNDDAFCADLNVFREKSRRRFEKNHAAGSSLACLAHPVSVIIPSYESLACLKECLKPLIALKEPLGLDIIVVDNASGNEVVEYLHELSENGHIHTIFNQENMGFTFAVNQGLRLAGKGRDILLLNNDAVVTPAAIPRLADAAWRLPSCGITAPQQLIPGGTPVLAGHIPYADPKQSCDTNISAYHRNVDHVPLYHDGEFLELNFAPFFCVYIRHDVLEDAGGMLDAEFGRHYRSDRIFCNVVRHIMGRKIYHVPAAVVHHKHQQSTKVLKQGTDQGRYQAMFVKNQWEPELARQGNFSKAPWDD